MKTSPNIRKKVLETLGVLHEQNPQKNAFDSHEIAAHAGNMEWNLAYDTLLALQKEGVVINMFTDDWKLTALMTDEEIELNKITISAEDITGYEDEPNPFGGYFIPLDGGNPRFELFPETVRQSKLIKKAKR